MAKTELGIQTVKPNPIALLNYLKGTIVQKLKADLAFKDIIDDYGYAPLFTKLDDKNLVIVGLVDMEKMEKWWIGEEEPNIVFLVETQTKLFEVVKE